MNPQTYITIALLSYLLGSIPFGYLLVKVFKKEDIRESGSGNIGATNVARSGAKGLAIATLILDVFKGTAALLLPQFLMPASSHRDGALILGLASLFVILGHCFPVWLKFKGGKGVATALGAFIILIPLEVLVAVLVFGLVFWFTHYVSLSSIVAALVIPVCGYIDGVSPRILTIVSLCCLIVVAKHHANIGRLIAGTENRFGAKPA